MTNKHTPTPWCVEDVFGEGPKDICLAYDLPGEGNPVLVATTFGGEGEGDGDPVTRRDAVANAAFIVKAVNAHEDLLAACKAARAFGAQGEDHDGFSVSEMLRAAIAKAEGEGRPADGG